jgi:hypothetical protein
MQPPDVDPMLDRARREAELAQLGVLDRVVLAACDCPGQP